MNKILYVGILAALFLGTMATTVQAASDKDQELIDAAGNGDLAKVKELINAGADMNLKATNGWTALRCARDNGHTEIVNLLKAAGAK